MIDLHAHFLPAIDDGAESVEVALDMARVAVANGVKVQACTPHIMPGVYNNNGAAIRLATSALQFELDRAEIPLRLVTGADIHIAPNLVEGLVSGRLLSLHDTRYVLLETPHHVAPARLDDCFVQLLSAGYVPIFTHPERLTWIRGHYESIIRLYRSGVWMQITAGSLLGMFGREAKYWGERMLDDGMVHILASDCHNVKRRPPNLAQGYEAAEKLVGAEEASQLVMGRPLAILKNIAPNKIPTPDECLQRAKEVSHDGKEHEKADRSVAPSSTYQESGFIDRSGFSDRMRQFFRRRV
ncbi:MAG: tyrosine-protein phosphatase [Beijerinckiaceae bacterium]